MQGPVNTPDEAFLALYGMAGSIVEMPPAVEPEDRRDGGVLSGPEGQL